MTGAGRSGNARELILARRAAFVAAALGGLGLASAPARGQPAPEPSPPGDGSGASDEAAEPSPEQEASPAVMAGEGQADGDDVPAATVAVGPADGDGAPRLIPLPIPTTAGGDPHGFSCPETVAEDTPNRAKAEVLVSAARTYLDEDKPDKALQLARRAFELTREPNLLLYIGKMERELGHPALARAALERYLACGSGAVHERTRADVLEGLEELRYAAGRVLIELWIDGAIINIDGEQVAVAPWPEPIYLTVGPHQVVVETPDGEIFEAELEVSAEGDVVIDRELLDAEDPMPCLQPCLSPPPPPSDFRNGPHLGVALAPQILWQVADDDLDVLAGGLGAALVNVGISRTVEFRLDAFGGATGGTAGAIGVFGGLLSMILGLSELVGVGTGASAGYLLAPESDALAAGAKPPGLFEPESSGFFAPHVSPLVLRFDELDLSARVDFVLSGQQDVAGERFGLSYVSTSLWLTYLFLDDDDWEEGDW